MNVSNIIVDFANTNKEFRTNDLSEYLSGKIKLSKKMLSWHLRKLLDESVFIGDSIMGMVYINLTATLYKNH